MAAKETFDQDLNTQTMNEGVAGSCQRLHIDKNANANTIDHDP